MPILTNAKNYTPPALRNKPSPLLAVAPSTKKTALKKEFAIEQTAFPALGDTIKKNTSAGTPISFSSAAAKKIETPAVVKVDVLPGWVHIRREAGKIQYKYGKPICRADDEYERAEEIRSRIILKNRIAREEYDRAMDIEYLGDLSEFYDQPTLAELFENEIKAAYTDESESSNESDQYYE